VPKLTKCDGGLDASRLGWQYLTPTPPPSDNIKAKTKTRTAGQCVPGVSMTGFDLGDVILGGSEDDCLYACEQFADKCKAYVYWSKVCGSSSSSSYMHS
jgi:hypothetical protein